MDNAPEIYRALGNETRLSIVRELARQNREVPSAKIVTSCSVALGLAQPTLSQHFARLVACGVLTQRKQGIEKFYKLNDAAIEAAGIDLKRWRR